MSEADGPTRDLTSSRVGSQSDTAASNNIDTNPTLDTPGNPKSGASQEDHSAPEPKSIGRYLLIKKLGEGGMGQVWLAEQTVPVRRQVALKLIKAGMYDDSVLQRFQAERQSLAIMDHPSIAKVFDAGTTPEGQPYFVMEYVPGLPITEYCDQKKLNINERLQLFIRVCESVQHAHQKAIIHRDLKPANILVVEVDGKPMPRIIDFGLAKAVEGTAHGDNFVTRFGGFVGTPGYMSPEQADPSVGDVDTRTDVYSLGVILYELLCGSLPFDTKKWQKQPVYELLRQLHEEDAPRPSTQIEKESESSSRSAESRGTEPRHLVRQLHDDLDWITMKAIEKDRARRYGTPSELAADITHYLKNEAVSARPVSTSYRLQKYAQRHRVAVAVAAALVLLLAGFAILQAMQIRRITRERDRANRITDFMTGMFKVSDPSEARGNSITAREILDRASKDVTSGLAQDPELQAQMMYVMGTVYESLGLYSNAQTLAERSADIRRRTLGPRKPDTLSSSNLLASVLGDEGHYPEAEKLFRETLDARLRVLGPDHPDTLRSMSNLAYDLIEEGHFDEGEKIDREVLEKRRRTLGPDDPETLNSMYELAHVLYAEGRFGEAERLDRETLEKRRRVLQSDDLNVLASEVDLASDLDEEGRFPEAEKIDREVLDARIRILGPEHPNTLTAKANLGQELMREGRYREAEEMYRGILETQRRVLGPEHPRTVNTMANLAHALEGETHYTEAEKLDHETVEIRRRILGPDHPRTLAAMNDLAQTLQLEGQTVEAEKLYRETLETQRRVLGLTRPDTLITMNNLASLLTAEKRYLEAEKFYGEMLDTERQVFGPEEPHTALTTYYLAVNAALRNRPDEALSLLQEAVDHGLEPPSLLEIEKNADLKALHGDPRFAALVAHAKEKAAAAEKTKIDPEASHL